MSVFDAMRDGALELVKHEILPSPFEYGFVVNAMFSALIIGPLLGGLGTLVVAKRMAFFSQAIGNSAMTGVAIGVLLGESFSSPYFSMFGFCILFALGLNYTRNRTQMQPDALIGVFLAVSLALGSSLLLFVSARVNTHILEAVLFGSILTVSDVDIYVLLVVAVASVAVLLPLFNAFLLGSLSPSLARVRGAPVVLHEYLFVLLITLVTVACLKVVGAVLVEALLLIPAAAARNLSRSLRGFVLWSMGISLFSCLAGVYVPMQWNIAVPSGGAIVLIAATIFLLTVIARSSFARFREARA